VNKKLNNTSECLNSGRKKLLVNTDNNQNAGQGIHSRETCTNTIVTRYLQQHSTVTTRKNRAKMFYLAIKKAGSQRKLQQEQNRADTNRGDTAAMHAKQTEHVKPKQCQKTNGSTPTTIKTKHKRKGVKLYSKHQYDHLMLRS
jgi:hypothetical protein